MMADYETVELLDCNVLIDKFSKSVCTDAFSKKNLGSIFVSDF